MPHTRKFLITPLREAYLSIVSPNFRASFFYNLLATEEYYVWNIVEAFQYIVQC